MTANQALVTAAIADGRGVAAVVHELMKRRGWDAPKATNACMLGATHWHEIACGHPIEDDLAEYLENGFWISAGDWIKINRAHEARLDREDAS